MASFNSLPRHEHFASMSSYLVFSLHSYRFSQHSNLWIKEGGAPIPQNLLPVTSRIISNWMSNDCGRHATWKTTQSGRQYDKKLIKKNSPLCEKILVKQKSEYLGKRSNSVKWFWSTIWHQPSLAFNDFNGSYLLQISNSNGPFCLKGEKRRG